MITININNGEYIIDLIDLYFEYYYDGFLIINDYNNALPIIDTNNNILSYDIYRIDENPIITIYNQYDYLQLNINLDTETIEVENPELLKDFGWTQEDIDNIDMIIIITKTEEVVIEPSPSPTIDPIPTTTPIIDYINESEYYNQFNNELVKLNVTSLAILIVLSMLLIKNIISSIFNR